MHRISNATVPNRSGTTIHGVVLLIASIMPVMAIISLVPVLPLLMQEFSGVPGAEFLVPMALTVPALSVALFSPLAGWLSDRLGRKNLLVVSLLLYSVFGTLPWFMDDLTQIIASRVVLGIMEAAIMTVATALIGDYFSGSAREKWIAGQVALASVAAIILIAVGGMLGQVLGSRGPFLLYILAIPIAVAAMIILFEPVKHRLGDAPAPVPFPLRLVLPLVIITLGVGVIFYTMLVKLGPVLQMSGTVSPAMIGVAGAAANVGVGVGTFLFQRNSARVGPFLLGIGLAICACGYLGAGLSTSFNMIAAFAVLTCIGSGMMLPNMLVWMMRILPAETRGRGTGAWTGAFFMGQFAAPIIAAAVAGQLGSLAMALVAFAVLAGIGAILALLFARGRSNMFDYGSDSR